MDTSQVLDVIGTAFNGVARPDTSLRQFLLTDRKGLAGTITDQEWLEAGRQRSDETWQQIPDAEIEECGVVLAHMQASEFRYYLPAYMHYAVRHSHLDVWKWEIFAMTVSSLRPSMYDAGLRHYAVGHYALFTRSQRQAIVQFLRFVVENAAEILRPDAKEALDRDWTNDVVRDGFRPIENP